MTDEKNYKQRRKLDENPLYPPKTNVPEELFEEFYKIQNNSDMTDEQKIFIQKIIDEVWEEAE